jgi:hypothetical protein
MSYTEKECGDCHNLVTTLDVPDGHDTDMWSIQAEEHDPECKWVQACLRDVIGVIEPSLEDAHRDGHHTEGTVWGELGIKCPDCP